jgi:hypothetical protein
VAGPIGKLGYIEEVALTLETSKKRLSFDIEELDLYPYYYKEGATLK